LPERPQKLQMALDFLVFDCLVIFVLSF